MNCIFCKIIKKELPSYSVYEDENTVAFLDIYPFVKGHTLVIPKKHSRWIWDSKEDEYICLMKSVRVVAELLKKAFDTDLIQVVVAGQGIFHTHVHLFPRVENDGYPDIPTQPISSLKREEMLQIQERVKNSS